MTDRKRHDCWWPILILPRSLVISKLNCFLPSNEYDCPVPCVSLYNCRIVAVLLFLSMYFQKLLREPGYKVQVLLCFHCCWLHFNVYKCDFFIGSARPLRLQHNALSFSIISFLLWPITRCICLGQEAHLSYSIDRLKQGGELLTLLSHKGWQLPLTLLHWTVHFLPIASSFYFPSVSSCCCYIPP